MAKRVYMLEVTHRAYVVCDYGDEAEVGAALDGLRRHDAGVVVADAHARAVPYDEAQRADAWEAPAYLRDGRTVGDVLRRAGSDETRGDA